MKINLARTSFNDDVAVLTDISGLLWVSLGGSGVGLRLEVVLLVRHLSRFKKTQLRWFWLRRLKFGFVFKLKREAEGTWSTFYICIWKFVLFWYVIFPWVAGCVFSFSFSVFFFRKMNLGLTCHGICSGARMILGRWLGLMEIPISKFG